MVDPSQLSCRRGSTRTARPANSSRSSSTELDALLVERIDRLDRDRWLTAGAGVVAALLLGWLAALLIAAASPGPAPGRPGRDPRGRPRHPAAPATRWQPAGRRAAGAATGRRGR